MASVACFFLQDEVLTTLSEWLADAACNRNPTLLLMAGTIYANEGMNEDALKACNSGLTLEMHALCVQVSCCGGWLQAQQGTIVTGGHISCAVCCVEGSCRAGSVASACNRVLLTNIATDHRHA